MNRRGVVIDRAMLVNLTTHGFTIRRVKYGRNLGHIFNEFDSTMCGRYGRIGRVWTADMSVCAECLKWAQEAMSRER